MKARDVIKPGETGVAIFTRGGHFIHKPDGSGTTGNWIISAKRKVDKVIIYKQDIKQGHHQVYVGVLVEIIDSSEAGRRKVKMADIQLVGTTSYNWNEFTDTKKGAINPVQYIQPK